MKTTDDNKPFQTHLFFFLFGTAIGVCLWGLSSVSEWDSNPLWVSSFITVLCFGLAAVLLWEPGARPHWVLLPPVMVFGLLVAWAWWQVPFIDDAKYDGDDFRQPTAILAVLLCGYLLLPYLQMFYQTRSRSLPYAQWFMRLVHNTYTVAMAGAFLGIFWILLFLWAALFELIDVEFFSDLFAEEGFAWLASASIMALGISLVRERSQWIETLQNNTFSLVRLLSPILALMGLLFVAVLPLTGLEALWDTGHASALLLTLAGFAIIFINTIYQDGQHTETLKPWLLRTMQILMLLLPIFTGLALYAVYLRVMQYGLMPSRWPIHRYRAELNGFSLCLHLLAPSASFQTFSFD